MVFNKESDFEEALIKILSEKGWEKEVLKNYSEQIYSLVETAVDATVNNTLSLTLDSTDKKINEFYAEFNNGRLTKEQAILLMSEAIKTVKVGSYGHAYMLDEKGTYLYHPFDTGKNIGGKDYIKEIRTYSSSRGIVIYIKDYLTKEYSRTNHSVDYDLAEINLGDIQFYDAFCRNSKIVIDLAVHSFQYYIDICKTLKYLGE